MHHKEIENLIEQTLKENPCELDLRRNEQMNKHTTFKVGGPADFYLRPAGDGFPGFCAGLLSRARCQRVPVFILGGGANIVVSDKGIRGIVLDTGAWNSIKPQKDGEENGIVFCSGMTLDRAVEYAVNAEFSGLEFLAGMPGTVGGALWMNARCYGREIADVLAWADVLDYGGKNKEHAITRIFTKADKAGFDYKISPFQGKEQLILSACFNLKKDDKTKIKTEMKKNKQDRKEKGHYLFPCAGSAFKNNRNFGKPSGQIIDELGLKGFSVGGAEVASFHGNILINTGGATANDIRTLMDNITAKVKAATGFILEPEILFVGES